MDVETAEKSQRPDAHVSPLDNQMTVVAVSGEASTISLDDCRVEMDRVTKLSDQVARPGDIVTVDLSLTAENDFVPDSLFDSEGQISFVLGWGNYLPGLHELISGMRVNQQYDHISIDAGYGEHRPELVVELSKEKLWENTDGPNASTSVRKGTKLELEVGTRQRRRLRVTVVDTTEETVIVDANPPLAGASYACTVKLLRIDTLPTCRLPSTDSTNREFRFQVATFALGCYWGAELQFMREPGVVGTKVGYTGGDRRTQHPTYQEVCEGTTRHREAVLVIYDSTVVSYQTLLQTAFQRLADTNQRYSHRQVTLASLFENEEDEESLQYRHAIFYHSDEQQRLAQLTLEHDNPYHVDVLPCREFFDAEEAHQQYLLKGGQSARKGAKEPIRCFG